MQVKITIVSEKSTVRDNFHGLRVGHGLSIHISLGNEQILFDLGLVGKILIRNMRNLNINPDEINKIVISHGHMDHVRGLGKFIQNRNREDKIPLYAHPSIREPKRACFRGLPLWNAGFPEMDEEVMNKVDFIYSRDPVKIAPKLFTTGEIHLDQRTELMNISRYFCNKVQGKWKQDFILDEQSLILQTLEGLVILCGCCHPGIVNTCRKAQELFDDEIVAIIGGVHLNLAKKERVEAVIENMKQNIGLPKLYLNHSTGKKALKTLKERLGEEIVKECKHGTKLDFKC